jgi:hypothetical protein
LAAARVPLLGLDGTDSRLGERLKLLAGDERDAPGAAANDARRTRMELWPAAGRRAGLAAATGRVRRRVHVGAGDRPGP